MKAGYAPKHAVFLPATSLAWRIAALFILGAGPFGCREWNSLSLLLILVAVAAFARSPQGIQSLFLSFLLSAFMFVAGSSDFLVRHPSVQDWLVVFSAYGVALYAIILIVPHIRANDMLDRARRSHPRWRIPLTWVTHIALAFFQGEQGLIETVQRALRASGIRMRLTVPGTIPVYLYEMFTALWLYSISRAYASAIAVRMRLEPRLMQLPTAREETGNLGYVVPLITAVAGFVIFEDFVLRVL